MIISHDFYLTDVIAQVATAKLTALSSAVDAARTAIAESNLRPSEKRAYTAELQLTAARRSGELLTPLRYDALRHLLLPVMEWVAKDKESPEALELLITALETHAMPVGDSPINYGLLDPDDEEDNWEIHDDPVAWRLLLEEDDEARFPHVRLNTYECGRFDWIEFVTTHRWTLPALHVELESGMSLPAPTETLADISQMVQADPHEPFWLRATLVPSSCPQLVVCNPRHNQLAVAETIIPRQNVAVVIRVDRMPEPAPGATSLRLDNALVMFAPCDVTGALAFPDHIPTRRNASLEMRTDGTITFL